MRVVGLTLAHVKRWALLGVGGWPHAGQQRMLASRALPGLPPLPPGRGFRRLRGSQGCSLAPRPALPLLSRSHLQKYRLSEGVTCVPPGARGHAASLRRLQQQLAPMPPMGLSGGSVDTELGAPAAKRARSSPTALPSPAIMAASSGVWPPLPALPNSADALPAFLGGLGPSDSGVPVLLPQPVGLALPLLPLPSMPAPAASAPAQPEQPEGLEKLLELAELAAAQHDELHSLELGASSDLDTLGQQLAASAAATSAVPPQQPGTCQPEVAARVAALCEQQAQLKAALAAHAQQHARLAGQLADFRRSVAELLSGLPQQMLTPVQLQQVQQQQQRDAAVQLVKSEPAAEQAEQPAAVPGSPGDRVAVASAALSSSAVEAAASSPHIASLIALIASAANSGAGPAPAHLQQLMQHAAQLAVAQPLA